MAKEPRMQKSETLTIRLDPKTRFILEFISRAKGQTITTVVERAIVETASNVSINDGFIKWQDIWAVSEGVRAIAIARQPELYPTFEEDQLIAFTKAHNDFFYVGTKNGDLRLGVIEIVWPRIKEFMDYWIEHKSHDYFGAGKKMVEAIRAAGVEPPVWPPGSKFAPKAASSGGRMNDVIDDDIPF